MVSRLPSAAHAASEVAGSALHVMRILDEVMDPELPAISITDLGIVRDVRVEGSEVIVALTPTYSGCPATEAIERDVLRSLREHGIDRVRIERRLAPAWTTDWITVRGRERLRMHGIAPPRCEPGSGIVVLSVAREGRELAEVTCPHCSSTNVEELSHFGSTPCKALYRCTSCREPFDYVKPH